MGGSERIREEVPPMGAAWWIGIMRVVRFAVLVAAAILLAYLGGRAAIIHWGPVWTAFR